MSEGIYRFSYSTRGGELAGIFVASAADVAALANKTAHLGEVNGKHSDVSIEQVGKHIKLVTEDTAAVAMFRLHDLGTGLNVPVLVTEWEADNADEDEEDAA